MHKLLFIFGLSLCIWHPIKVQAAEDREECMNLISMNLADPDGKLSMKCGAWYVQAKQLDTALEFFNLAVKHAPKNPQAYSIRGAFYGTFLKEPQKAIEDFNKALALDPKLAIAYYGRAWNYDALGKFAQAEADYLSAIKFTPDFELPYINLAMLLVRQARSQEAEKYAAQALKLNAKNEQALLPLIIAKIQLKKYTEADQLLQNVSTTVPQLKFTHYFLSGLVANALQKYDEALKYLQTANSMQANDVEVLYALASTQMYLKQYAKARKTYNKLVALAPNASNIYLSRAIANVRLGKYKEALADSQKVIQLDPKNYVVYFNMTEYYLDMKKAAKALETLQKYIAKAPKAVIYENDYILWKQKIAQLKRKDKAIADTIIELMDTKLIKVNNGTTVEGFDYITF